MLKKHIIFVDNIYCLRYNATNKSVEARKVSVTGEERGNVPVKGFAAEIEVPVSAGLGLVLRQNMPWTVTVCGVLPRMIEFLCRGVSLPRRFYFERRRDYEKRV